MNTSLKVINANWICGCHAPPNHRSLPSLYYFSTQRPPPSWDLWIHQETLPLPKVQLTTWVHSTLPHNSKETNKFTGIQENNTSYIQFHAKSYIYHFGLFPLFAIQWKPSLLFNGRNCIKVIYVQFTISLTTIQLSITI